MKYLLDTNVISEAMKAKPNKKVMQWTSQIPLENLFISVLSLGEIRKGVEKLLDSKKKQKLNTWLDVELANSFDGRVVSVDEHIAECWGRMLARAQRPIAAIDGLLAATAIHVDMTLVTRNTKDFAGLPVELFNPWLM